MVLINITLRKYNVEPSLLTTTCHVNDIWARLGIPMKYKARQDVLKSSGMDVVSQSFLCVAVLL